MNQTPQEQPPRKKISAEEFVKIWRGDYKGVEDYEEYYQKNDYGKHYIVFNNYVIDESIFIEDIEGLRNIELINTVTKNIIITNASLSNDIHISSNSKTGDITIANCTLRGRLRVGNRSTTGDIFVRSKSSINGILISTNSRASSVEVNDSDVDALVLENSAVGNFSFRNNSSVTFLSLKNAATIRNVSVSNKSKIFRYEIFGSSIQLNALIHNSDVEALSIEDKSKVGHTTFYDSNLNTLFIEKSSVKGILSNKSVFGEVIIDNSSASQFVIRYDSNIKDIYINKSSINNIAIEDSLVGSCVIENKSLLQVINILDSKCARFKIYNSMLAELKVKDSAPNSIYLSRSKLQKLALVSLKENAKNILIESCEIDDTFFQLYKACDIIVKGFQDSRSILYNMRFSSMVFPSNAYLHISQTYVDVMKFESFLNKGSIILNELKPTTQFSKQELNRFLYPSFIDKIFDNSNELCKSIFALTDSDLGNTQFIGCDLDLYKDFRFKNSKMLSVFLADTTLPHTKRINIVGGKENEQRKLALGQFKKIYENQGDTVRANKYRAEELKIYQKQITPWSNFGTWLVLGLSNITSNFGQSIWRPLAALLAVHYWLFMWAIGVEAFEWHGLKELPYYYFFLANPIRLYIFQTDWTIIIDIIMRAWSSYMIYNFIRASRRFIN